MVALCVLGVVAMTTSTEHLRGLGQVTLSSPAPVPGDVNSTSAGDLAHGAHHSHESSGQHGGGVHLMALCMLVVATVATLIRTSSRRSAGVALTTTGAGSGSHIATAGSRPPPVAWPHDHLCVFLR